ncbi:MAG: hypothetical protein KDB04_00930 [Acidimicrobiales bacterium]|nr:hypothetical protein [Acidimicrobiales bacterium]HRW39458.1 hypothetical protein [Aquihabitans sp.]
MLRSPRLARYALIGALALGASACGVDAGDQGDALKVTDATTTSVAAPEGAPSTTEPSDDPGSTDDGSIQVPEGQRDQLVAVYTEMGFTEDEASCLADRIVGADSIDPSDATALMDLINQCDIPMSRLMELGGDIMGEDADPGDAMRNSLAAGFRASGMSDEQADCVADGFIDEFGADASAAGDPSAMAGLFEDCGVDPADLGN